MEVQVKYEQFEVSRDVEMFDEDDCESGQLIDDLKAIKAGI